MIVRLSAVTLGLMAFSVSVTLGISQGRAVTDTLSRSLLAMLILSLVGAVAGWSAGLVLSEHASRRDQEFDAERAAESPDLTATASAAGQPVRERRAGPA